MKFNLLSLAVAVAAMLMACNGNNNTQQPQPVSNGHQQAAPAATPENNAAAAQSQPAANAQALPEAINAFVQQNFPGAKVTYTETDQDHGGIEYEVTLDNGTKIDFDVNQQWDKIECYKGVPAALVPQAITTYVKNNFQATPIIKIDKDNMGYDIELTNGMELKFDQSGNFIGMDD